MGEQEESKRSRPIIDYGTPDPSAFRNREIGWCMIAATLTTATALLTVFALVVSKVQLGPVFPVAVVCAALSPLVAIAIYRWKRWAARGFALGLLIGIAMAGLIEGLCFKMV